MMLPQPAELIVVRTERSIRVCLAYTEDSAAKYEDNTLIKLGIEQSLPVLREYYGRRYYIVRQQSVEHTPNLVKVVLDLSLP
ncbi:MAG: hypothetical protein ABIH23_01855 [bacterium]